MTLRATGCMAPNARIPAARRAAAAQRPSSRAAERLIYRPASAGERPDGGGPRVRPPSLLLHPVPRAGRDRVRQVWADVVRRPGDAVNARREEIVRLPVRGPPVHVGPAEVEEA